MQTAYFYSHYTCSKWKLIIIVIIAMVIQTLSYALITVICINPHTVRALHEYNLIDKQMAWPSEGNISNYHLVKRFIIASAKAAS